MVLLQEDKGEWPLQHLAFTVDSPNLEHAANVLPRRGIAVEGTAHVAWTPAQSVYFSDPDGHSLERCAPMSAVWSGPA